MPPKHDPKSFPPPWNYLIPLGTKVLLWGLFFLVLYLLRSFMQLVFLTFVFAYIAEHGVEGLEHRIASRKWRTAVVFSVMIAVMVAVGVLLAPQIRTQAAQLERDRQQIIDTFNDTIEKLKKQSPTLKSLLGSEKASVLVSETLGLGHPSAGAASQDEPLPQELPRQITDFEDRKQVLSTFSYLVSIVVDIASLMTMFLLSLLFAFLIVRDLPKVTAGVESLHDTKLQIFYDEVRSTVVQFGRVLGRFLEAQLVIAIINTVLTAIGMSILGIQSKVVLSAFVFLCSFIPVAGVFISTAPICLVAIQPPHGSFETALWAIAMVTMVHMLEAYVLNPLIVGHHLRLNPVLVLAVLIIGHKLFGIWGLLLGVPTVTYVLGHAIQVVQGSKDPAPG